MSLRIAALLFAVLSPLMLPAEDDGREVSAVSPGAKRHKDWGHGVIILGPTAEGLTASTITVDLLAPFMQTQPAGQHRVLSLPLLQPSQAFHDNNLNVVIGAEQEFPFSPRRLHQWNYDAQSADATLVFDEFTNSGFLFQLGNTVASEALLPVIIPAAATMGDGVRIIQQAAGEACSSQCANGSSLDCSGSTDDECPLDVEFSDFDDPSEAPRPLTHIPEPPPGLPMYSSFDGFDCLFDFAQAAYGEPAPVDPTAAGESCSHAEPPLKAKVEHLLEAARHLAGAGYEDEAKLFRVEAEAIQRASTRLLTEKRQELERLQREIAELESLTGQYTMIQLKCRILEVTLPAGCAPDPQLAMLTKAGYCIVPKRPRADACESAASCQCGTSVNDLLGTLESHDCASVKTIASPTLITTNGHSATLQSGGEFPVLIPVSGSEETSAEAQARVEWKNFGVRLQAVPFVLGNGKLRLSLDAEISDRDFSNAVSMAGSVVPGLTTRRSRTDIETSFGDTVVLRCCNSTTKDGDRTLLMLVTAHQIEPLPEPPANAYQQVPYTR